MTPTRSVHDTIRARAERDPAFRDALLTEAVDQFLAGDLDTGKAVLAVTSMRPSASSDWLRTPHGTLTVAQPCRIGWSFSVIPLSRTTAAKRKEIRDPGEEVPRSGSECCTVANRRTLRDFSCWIPDLLPLTLQSSGKGGSGKRVVSPTNLSRTQAPLYDSVVYREETGSSSKSLMRMLGPTGNPTAGNLFSVLHVVQKAAGVHLVVTSASAG